MKDFKVYKMSGNGGNGRWETFFTQHCGSKDLYHVYIGKERYCHSSVVARISMYGERIRYIIKTELRQQRDF